MEKFMMGQELCFNDKSEIAFVEILKDGEKLIVPKFFGQNKKTNEREYFYNEPNIIGGCMVFLANDESIEEMREATYQEYEDFITRKWELRYEEKRMFCMEIFYEFKCGFFRNVNLADYENNYLKTARNVFENLECYFGDFDDYDESDQEKIILKMLEMIDLFCK